MPCLLKFSEARPRFAGLEFLEFQNIHTALNEMARNLSREPRFFAPHDVLSDREITKHASCMQ
jgi:hypothetical protein